MAGHKPRVVCCIGDIHGHHTKLLNLWSNLQSAIDPPDFRSALVIFLGDYCDRGPDTSKVIDFLIALPSKYPNQKHVFLAGNHEFAFAAFLRLLPPPTDGSPFSEGWKEFDANEDREGWYKGEGYENMHLQGRRWAGKIKPRPDVTEGITYNGSIYDSATTFQSYGVPHGSSDLVKAVPEKHKKFLAHDLVWVHEEDDVCVDTIQGIKHCKLIAVHAGLESKKSVEEQIQCLRVKETKIAKLMTLCGRKNVLDIPQELTEEPTIVVSGHHTQLHVDGLRLIIDEGGGYEDRPIAAIVLPWKKIVRDTDNVIAN